MNLYDAFEQAIALPTLERQHEFLAQLQQQSKELAQELAQLLNAASDAGEHTLGVKKVVADVAASWCAKDFSAELTGHKLGIWHLEKLLAQGGMSAVYLASRQDGQFEQQVAIKVLNPLIYPVTAQSKAFDEAGLCARLSHAAITTVLDAGLVEHQEEQAHYIVMEYVEGEPLQLWLEKHKPSLHVALNLFSELCNALHYAHTHQVVHADLKPANILVDTEGRARLIDFGISQLQQKEQIQDEVVQRYVRAMSFGFASPEQLAGQPLSTLSDIFSLGKVLAFVVAKTQQSKLQQRECQAIVNKATAHEPGARYLSMRDMQQDIQAILRARTISVFQGSVAYRTRKFALRQPVISILGCSLIAGVMGFAVALWQHNNALMQEQQVVNQVSEFMVDVFNAADPESYDGNPISAQDLLIAAKSRLETTAVTEEVKHRLQLQLASALSGIDEHTHALELLDKIPPTSQWSVNKQLLKVSIRLDQSELEQASLVLDQLQPEQLSPHSLLKYQLYRANISHFKGEFEKSLQQLVKAEQMAYQIAQYSDLLNIKNYKLANYFQLGDVEGQLREAKESVALASEHFDKNSPQMIAALHSLQGAYASAEKYKEAQPLLEEVLILKQKLFPKDHPTIAMTLNELGSNYASLGDYQKAVKLHQQAVEIIASRYQKRHIDYIYGQAYLGNAHGYLGQHDQAIAAHKLSYDASVVLFGADNLVTLNAMVNLAQAYHEKSEHQTAKEWIEKALMRARKQFDENSIRIALYKASYGSILFALKDIASAKTHLQQALDVMKTTLGESHSRTIKTQEKLTELQQSE